MCLLQVSFAFGRIESALNYILNHLNELSGLAAQAERLDALLAGGPFSWSILNFMYDSCMIYHSSPRI